MVRASDSMIIVVNSTVAGADKLKKLIQFMDAPHVCSATPGKWLRKIGKHRLEAVFVGPDLNHKERATVVGEVGGLDPNVPIVMIGGSETAC